MAPQRDSAWGLGIDLHAVQALRVPTRLGRSQKKLKKNCQEAQLRERRITRPMAWSLHLLRLTSINSSKMLGKAASLPSG